MAKGRILIPLFSALFLLVVGAPAKAITEQKLDDRSPQPFKSVLATSGRDKAIDSTSAKEIKRLIAMAIRGQSRAINAAKPWRIVEPEKHISKFQIADALMRGHGAALVYYRSKQYAKAAERLALMFDLTADLINLVAPESDPEMPAKWITAWKSIGLEFPYYILELNDYGYFLQKAGNHADAVKVLTAVVAENPKRTAAHINLADSLWETNQPELAIDHYQTYRSLMIANDNELLIPPRVSARVSPINISGN